MIIKKKMCLFVKKLWGKASMTADSLSKRPIGHLPAKSSPEVDRVASKTVLLPAKVNVIASQALLPAEPLLPQ